jgi:hypothetical protein
VENAGVLCTSVMFAIAGSVLTAPSYLPGYSMLFAPFQCLEQHYPLSPAPTPAGQILSEGYLRSTGRSVHHTNRIRKQLPS